MFIRFEIAPYAKLLLPAHKSNHVMPAERHIHHKTLEPRTCLFAFWGHFLSQLVGSCFQQSRGQGHACKKTEIKGSEVWALEVYGVYKGYKGDIRGI